MVLGEQASILATSLLTQILYDDFGGVGRLMGFPCLDVEDLATF